VSLDVRADVYAAGVVLYEMLADQRPFSYERRSQLLRAHLFEPVPKIERVRPGLYVHPDLERLILRALEKDPARRFTDGAEMLRALEALPAEPASFQEQRRDAVRSRTGSSSAVVISAAERLAVTTGMDVADDADADDTGSMSMETVHVALDSSARSGGGRRPEAIPDTLSGLARVSERARGNRVSAGTTSSHPRPGKRSLRKRRRRVKGPPRWLWAVAVASVCVSFAIYWWTQMHGGALP
jgi:serine/threonine protein kinase